MKVKSGHYLHCLHLAPLVLAVTAAHANPNDSLQLSAAYSLSHDDNLFRLTDKNSAPALVGRSSPAETIKTAVGGLRFERDYGLQHVKLDASAVNYDYQNFSYLGFSAFNYNGVLQWQLTPRFRGMVISKREESLNSFGDVRNFSVRNQRITKYNALDATYELDGAWRVRGALSRIDLQNSATILEQRSFTINSADIGLVRQFSSRSELSYRYRKGSGEYSAVSFAATGFLPSSYDESEHELRMLWLVTDKTKLDSRVSYLQKKYNEFNFRDNSGITASSNLDWSVTSRVNLQVGLARDRTDFQSLYSSFATIDKLTILPRWQIKEKLSMSLRHEISKRDFKGNVPTVLTTARREDNEKLTRLSLDWVPREFISVSTWLQRRSRDSNFTGFPYTSNSVGLDAQISF